MYTFPNLILYQFISSHAFHPVEVLYNPDKKEDTVKYQRITCMTKGSELD